MQTTRTNKTLDRSGRTALIIWISKNEEAIRSKSDAAISVMASKELGIEITPSMIKGQRAIQFPSVERAHQGSPIIAMVRRVEASVSSLTERLAAPEKSLGV